MEWNKKKLSMNGQNKMIFYIPIYFNERRKEYWELNSKLKE